MISLFPHNETAYESVLSVLSETGKAAGRLTQTQIQRLDALGFSWEERFTQQWKDAYDRLLAYSAGL